MDFVSLVHSRRVMVVPKFYFFFGKFSDFYIGVGFQETQCAPVVPAVPVVQFRTCKKQITERAEISEYLCTSHQAGIKTYEIKLIYSSTGQSFRKSQLNFPGG